MTQYLNVDSLIAINVEVGGAGAGLADRGGVEFAADRPSTRVFGVEKFPDLWSKAAAYIHGIGATQYFTDGNKRTAWVAATTFLALNGRRLPRVRDVDAEALVRCVANDLFSNDSERDRSIEVAAEWFRTQYEQQRRAGPAFDSRLEFVQLCFEYLFDEGRGVYAIGQAGFDILSAVGGFPFPSSLKLV